MSCNNCFVGNIPNANRDATIPHFSQSIAASPNACACSALCASTTGCQFSVWSNTNCLLSAFDPASGWVSGFRAFTLTFGDLHLSSAGSVVHDILPAGVTAASLDACRADCTSRSDCFYFGYSASATANNCYPKRLLTTESNTYICFNGASGGVTVPGATLAISSSSSTSSTTSHITSSARTTSSSSTSPETIPIVSITSSSTTDGSNNGLVIGVIIGVASAIVLGIGIFIGFIVIRRKKTEKKQPEESNIDSQSTFPSETHPFLVYNSAQSSNLSVGENMFNPYPITSQNYYNNQRPVSSLSTGDPMRISGNFNLGSPNVPLAQIGSPYQRSMSFDAPSSTQPVNYNLGPMTSNGPSPSPIQTGNYNLGIMPSNGPSTTSPVSLYSTTNTNLSAPIFSQPPGYLTSIRASDASVIPAESKTLNENVLRIVGAQTPMTTTFIPENQKSISNVDEIADPQDFLLPRRK
ncbi:hypothetical protein HK096_003242, partial [Nowakowskiella sp. JEL0078]